MAEIFISYKSDRRNAAKHLSGILDRYGYSVWFDYSLIKGEDFDFQLDRQLRAAKVVVVLWCSMSVESLWVSREASLAAKLRKFLPVLIEDCELKLAHHTSDYVDLRV
jgi:TIR domain